MLIVHREPPRPKKGIDLLFNQIKVWEWKAICFVLGRILYGKAFEVVTNGYGCGRIEGVVTSKNRHLGNCNKTQLCTFLFLSCNW
jgi:hypothetical protein